MKEDYRQRMTTKQWRELLLSYMDNVIFKGVYRQLIAKPIAPGIVEVYKKADHEKGT